MKQCRMGCIHEDACRMYLDNDDWWNISEDCPEYKDKFLFVESPCKVGDEVYLIQLGEIIKGRVVEINLSASGNVVVVDLIFNDFVLFRNRAIYFTQFGEIAFLNKENADRKLKEIKNGNNYQR